MLALNNANKEVYLISDTEYFKRVLLLGSDNGSYSIFSSNPNNINWKFLDTLIQKNPNEVLDILNLFISRCKKKETLIYALAYCVTYEIYNKTYIEFRKQAYELLPIMCNIPTKLFMFISYCKELCKQRYSSVGWNNLHKRAIQNWYNNKNAKFLEYQVTKYRNRYSYTHKDVLRLAHIIPNDENKKLLYKYIINGNAYNEYLKDFEILKKTNDINLIVELIHKHNFVREHIPTSALNSANVWTALLENMPDIALLRNLNKITSLGVFNNSNVLNDTIKKIENMQIINPLQVLITLKTYSNGSGFSNNLSWYPNKHIVSALNTCYKNLYKELQPTYKRVCIALDVSPSMFAAEVCGTQYLNSAEAVCALTMVLKQADPTIDIMGFTNNFVHINIDPTKSLDENLKSISNNVFDSTDISLPFTWALKNKKKYDAFIVMTDNETNSNSINPMDALQNYRNTMNIPDCKLVVLATSLTQYSVANPEDKYTLDICGFDASIFDVIKDLILS